MRTIWADNHLAAMAEKINSQKKTYNILDAVEKALEEHKKPMHYAEIADFIVKKGWYTPTTNAPEHSVHTSIWKDINRKTVPSRFVFENAIVSLLKWGSPLGQKIAAHTKAQKAELLAALKEMNCYKFEEFIEKVILPGMGIEECKSTPMSRDGGIDVTGVYSIHDSVKIFICVQAKRFKGLITSKTVRQLRGAICHSGAHGVIITTGAFTKDAQVEANKMPYISLIDGHQLVDILFDMNHPDNGIEKEDVQLVKINKEHIKNYGMNADPSSLS